VLLEAMRKLMRAVCLFDDLHLMFLCIPAETGIYLPDFANAIWEEIFRRHGHVIGLITGKTQADLQKFIVRGVAGRLQLEASEKTVYEKIYAASVLAAVIEERSLASIERQFEIDRGSIQALQSSSASFAGQGAKFAEAMGFNSLSVALLSFLRRLSFGVKAELIDLMALPSMRRDVARAMFDSGIRSPQDLLGYSVDQVAQMMPQAMRKLGDDEVEDVAMRIMQEAAAICEQMAMLEMFEEEAALKKVMKQEDEQGGTRKFTQSGS
jgi:replicative superfamily II helicase